jgi:hypothetical protein
LASLEGANCLTLGVGDLYRFAIDAGISRSTITKTRKRQEICKQIQERLIYLEKYATSDGKFPKKHT